MKNLANMIYSREFEELNRLFKTFNPLKVLRMDNHEIRHSNVLAWLMDHEENHGLNSVFLEKLISRMLMKPENNSLTNDSDFFLKVLSMKFSDWKVEREKLTDKKRRIDLVLSSKENKTVIFIENKFYSTQSENQLKDYLTFINEKYNGYKVLPVFLTLNEEDTDIEEYWTLNYADIATVLEFILKFYEEAVSEEVYVFLKNYLSILHERFAPDQERLALAEKIFENHGEAVTYLYLLNNRGIKTPSHHQLYKEKLNRLNDDEETWMTKIYDSSKDTIDFIYNEGALVIKKAFVRFIDDSNLQIQTFDAAKTSPSFLHPDWSDYKSYLKKLNGKAPYWLDYGLIIFFKRKANNRLKLYLELGNLEYSYRIQLIEKLETNGFPIKENSKTVNSMYTRIYTDQVEVEDWSSVDNVQKAIEELTSSNSFKQAIDQINASLEAASSEISDIEAIPLQD